MSGSDSDIDFDQDDSVDVNDNDTVSINNDDNNYSGSTVSSPEFKKCVERSDMCPEYYLATCGYDKNGRSFEFANECFACSDKSIINYTIGKCSNSK